MYANCPILWVIWMKMESAIITMEDEYVALSQKMRDVFTFEILMK